MMTERKVKALREQIAQRLFELEAPTPALQDEGDDGIALERGARADRLRMAFDVLTTVLAD